MASKQEKNNTNKPESCTAAIYWDDALLHHLRLPQVRL